VVIEVHAVSVNRTLDLVVRAGRYAKPIALPHILGVDPSGIVVEVGEGVTERKVGDRVITLPWRKDPRAPSDSVGIQYPGGYAEYVKLPAHATTIVPDGVDFPTATLIARHAPAAYTQVRAAALKEGEWALVMGAAGGLGSSVIQVAKNLGAKVIAAAGADDRCSAALELGADAAVNYRTQDLTAEVLRHTGAGADVVFENIGDPTLFSKALLAMARHGRMVTSGAHGGGKVELDVNRLYLYQLSILGRLGANNKDAELALDDAAAGKFKVLIDRVMPLKEAPEAHRLVDSRTSIGKVILSPRA
ncbi:MAG TPA: zinc-binding dehydrogenase, partial [Terricaulis sp.]|nr:zinc-binding dehydrogenase [Terricaulis sp.]